MTAPNNDKIVTSLCYSLWFGYPLIYFIQTLNEYEHDCLDANSDTIELDFVLHINDSLKGTLNRIYERQEPMKHLSRICSLTFWGKREWQTSLSLKQDFFLTSSSWAKLKMEHYFQTGNETERRVSRVDTIRELSLDLERHRLLVLVRFQLNVWWRQVTPIT